MKNIYLVSILAFCMGTLQAQHHTADTGINFLHAANWQDVLAKAKAENKYIFMDAYTTWCGPCKAEIPSLVELQEKYADDLVVLGFSVDDTPEKMKPYSEEYKVNYPLLVGNGREDVQNAFGPLLGIPVSVIIGRDGVIAKKHTGIATKEQFEREIQSLL